MFITFEGPEGSGKSTAARGIADLLENSGRSVLLTREPGATWFGIQVRQLLLHGEDIPAASEVFLFLADRANHVANLVRPALAEGKIVLCDRFGDSTVVYQGHGRGFDLEWLRSLNEIATDTLVPDLTLLFDRDPEIGLARVQEKDRLDSESIDFHRRVRTGFLAEALREPERWRKLDASQSPEAVLRATWEAIRTLLI
jgi:dTMP kinase